MDTKIMIMKEILTISAENYREETEDALRQMTDILGALTALLKSNKPTSCRPEDLSREALRIERSIAKLATVEETLKYLER